MLDFLINALGVSLFCCGLHLITREGWVLDRLDYWFIEVLGGRITYTFDVELMEDKRVVYWRKEWAENVYKPVLGCIVCMGSVWGVIGGLLTLGVTIWLIPFTIVVACLNGAIYFNLLKHWE